jgi:UDP-glucose 4-epimerase
VASGTETSLRTLAEMLARVMGTDLAPEHEPARKVNPVQRRLADIDKARRLIDFKSTIPLDEGLARLVEWWKAQ